MKNKSILTAIVMLLVTGLLKGQDVKHDIRVGIAALQGGNSSYPEYVRIFQLSKSRAEVQWGYIEKEQGVYDFSVMDEKLEEIKQLNRDAIIKLNANRKPDWLFDIVPFTTKKLSGAIDDPQGTLMYWHPAFIDAYEKLLIAFGKYLETTPYRDIITGIRMNFNSMGVEHTSVPQSHWPLDKWIIPEAVDSATVKAYTNDIPYQYKETVVDFYVQHILPYAYVWTRTNLPDGVINKYKNYYEDGRLGFFHTGASMEQNQIYFNDTHRYTRFIQYCRTGQTMGFTEVDGYHNYTNKYSSDEVFKMTQFNYWRMLSEMHCGVSLAGVHLHMFKGQLDPDGPELNFFEVPEMDAGWRFTDKYIGLHASPKASPGAWVALRDDTGDQYQGDYTFLMEREGNNPIAPLTDNYPDVDDGSVGKRKVGSELVRFGAWARGLPSGKTMTFHVDPRVFSPGERRIARVVYFDEGFGTWQLKQGDEVKMSVSNEDTREWIEKDVMITTDGNKYEIVNTGPDEVIFHMLEVKRAQSTKFQSSYQGMNSTIPGLIEAEHYDFGGEGVAYHDDDKKEGDINFRPEDNVDVVAKVTASNDSVVSYTNDGEWLEYTVDVTAGNYDINLYYFCGENSGDLVVSLDGNVLDTITGLQNLGWEIHDSIAAQNIFLGNGGKKKVLRLEFVNGAGFDIDAIKFNKQFTPVNGVTLTGCPSDTLFIGNTRQLMANLTPYYADDLTVTWNSSNESVATVDSSGMVTSISEGKATITVTTNDGGFTDTCEINSMIEVISVYGLTMANCPATILQTGDTHQLVANVAPADATDKTVTWSSSNTSIATVDANGVITAKSQGSVTITANTNDGGYTETCAIGIMSTGIPVTGVTIAGCPADVLKADSTYQLIVNVTPANAGDLRVNWSSSDEAVAKVDENGWLTTFSSGKITITATTSEGGFTGECTLVIDVVNGVDKFLVFSSKVKVYPNPVSNNLFLTFPGSGLKKNITIYNPLGQLLLAKATHNNHFEIDVSDFLQYKILIVGVFFGETAEYFKVLTNT